MTPLLRIYLLGDFRLLAGDTPVVALHSPRLQALLAYLVLHRNAPQPRRHLAFCLWPDSSEIQAQTNLRNLVFQLRHTLPHADYFLCLDGTTLQWRVDAPYTLDVADFEQAINQAEQAAYQAEREATRVALEAAISCYHGDLLPSCYDEWIVPERERLRQVFAAALERLIALLEARRDYLAAISYARRLLQHEPLHETTYLHLMRLYALSGDRAAALHTYQTCVALLARELAVEPGQPLRDAYARLVAAADASWPTTICDPPISLVGRQRELEALLHAWRTAEAGRPHVVVLAGEAGIGKTRLAEEMLHWADQQGFVTASAHCYPAESDLVYAPVIAWLRARPIRAVLARLSPIWLTEIARLVPELLDEQPDLPPPGPLSEPWQRQRLFEALARAILAPTPPLLLLIDDLQWCDRATLDWLRHLLHYDASARFLLVGAMRPEEVGPDHPLAGLLTTLRERDQVTEIALGPLGAAETALLAAQVTGQKLSAAQADDLYQATEGNPLFVIEMVHAASETGPSAGRAAANGTGATDAALPPRMQAVIAARLAKLSPLAYELAGLAATIGRTFSFAILARASAVDEEALVRGLDELCQRRIICERGEQRYDFSHDKLREVAYAQLSDARRRRWHRRVAEALESFHADQLDAVSARLAAHYAQAGCLEPAIRAYQRVAAAARWMHANAEAITYYRQALALLEAAAPEQFSPGKAQELIVQVRERLDAILMVTEEHK